MLGEAYEAYQASLNLSKFMKLINFQKVYQALESSSSLIKFIKAYEADQASLNLSKFMKLINFEKNIKLYKVQQAL